LWPALRQRPFSKVADPETVPHSIFVTAMDTNPLAPSASALLNGQDADFTQGITLLSKLTDGSVFVCKAPDDKLPTLDGPRVKIEEFSGPHPAGNVGTHIHFLDPVGRHKTVWHIGLQDVIAVAKLFTTGKLYTDRLISLAGPAVTEPRIIRTRIGACVEEIVQDELKPGENRVISGSVLSGFQAAESLEFLGRHHQQISVVQEDRQRRFLGWLSLGYSLFSVKNIVISKLFKEKPFNFTTSTQGQLRAIVPSGTFEDLMPMDIMPLFLMRALAVDDVEEAEALGALELDEEDLSLCAFTCPSKLEFGPILRRNLTIIEKEG
jgi:Na+-transporting NADH:ubiquinone oxidoreductase subunit A